MNKWMKKHVKNNPDGSLSPSGLYDEAKTAFDFFRFERDEARLLKDLLGRFEKLTIKIDKFVSDNANRSEETKKKLTDAVETVRRDTSKNLDADVKGVFKIMSEAISELNNSKKEAKNE